MGIIDYKNNARCVQPFFRDGRQQWGSFQINGHTACSTHYDYDRFHETIWGFSNGYYVLNVIFTKKKTFTIYQNNFNTYKVINL